MRARSSPGEVGNHVGFDGLVEIEIIVRGRRVSRQRREGEHVGEAGEGAGLPLPRKLASHTPQITPTINGVDAARSPERPAVALINSHIAVNDAIVVHCYWQSINVLLCSRLKRRNRISS